MWCGERGRKEVEGTYTQNRCFFLSYTIFFRNKRIWGHSSAPVVYEATHVMLRAGSARRHQCLSFWQETQGVGRTVGRTPHGGARQPTAPFAIDWKGALPPRWFVFIYWNRAIINLHRQQSYSNQNFLRRHIDLPDSRKRRRGQEMGLEEKEWGGVKRRNSISG